MTKILIVVDYQNDFVNGLLPCGQMAIDIEIPLYNKVKEYLLNGDRVIFTRDIHPSEDYHRTFESTIYPEHCLCDWNNSESKYDLSYGANFYGKLFEFNTEEFVEGRSNPSILNKFQNMSLFIENFIDGHKNLEITICGLATNVCVLTTALYLRSIYEHKSVEIKVDSSLCASFSKEAHDTALEVLKGNGVIVE